MIEPGKVYFSKKRIDPENPKDLNSNFKSGEYIYGLAILERDFKTLSCLPDIKKSQIEIVISDGDELAEYTGGMAKDNILSKSYFEFEIVPDPEDSNSYNNPDIEFKRYPNPAACDGPIRIANKFSELPSGKHKIAASIKFNYVEVAKGEFEIEGRDFSIYSQITKNIIAAADSGATEKAGVPEAKMKDAELEAKMIKALKSSNDFKERINGKEVIKLAITDPEWYIRRHEITNDIMLRYIRAAAAIEDRDGNYWVYKTITFEENYSGGKYQTLKYNGCGDRYKILLENIK